MRAARLIGGMTLLLALALSARAEPVPYKTTVAVPEVEVRSGPSPKFYATSKLHRGDPVTVVKEAEGGAWVAIEPPAGSFSWINTRFLEHSGQKGLVLGDDVPLRVGSQLSNAAPEVVGVKVSRGQLLWVLDEKKAYNEDGSWLPVTPAPKEVRYIPADAIKASAVVSATASAPAGPTAPGTGAPAPAAEDPLWTQALQAEQAGNLAEAERLYVQLAHQTNDHELALRCYNRVNYLHQGQIGARPGYPSGQPSQAYYPNGGPDNRLAPAPSNSYSPNPPAYPPKAQATSQYSYVRDTGARPPVQAALSTQAPAQAPAYSQAPAPAPQWSGYGWLRRAPFFLDNKPTYALESSQGALRLYVTAQPGVSLDSYVGSTVNLYGPVTYHGTAKTYYMTAVQVAPLR